MSYAKWLDLTGREDENVYIPHKIVGYQLTQGISTIATWRKYLKMTQKELAAKTGMTQPAIAQIEKLDSKPHVKTIKKIALAMGLNVEQVTD